MPPRTSLPPLRVSRPDLAGEFLQVIDQPLLTPDDLSAGSNRKVLWRCGACGSEWAATVASRARVGTGCPVCAVVIRGRSRAAVARGRISAAEKAPGLPPELVENLTRPGLTLDHVLPATRDRCRWRCACCRHEWVATVSNRVSGRGCPRCADASRSAARAALRPGQLNAAAAWPQLVPEFRQNLRRPGLGLADVAANSLDRCEWVCPGCGHGYEATVANRGSKGSGCPRCGLAKAAATRLRPGRGRSLAEVHPLLAQQFVANISRPGRDPSGMRGGTNDACRWQCQRGHEWTTTVAARVLGGSGCPRCGRSGQSRLELEVAGLLAAATGRGVTTDVRLKAGGRSWRVDLAIALPDGRQLLVDLDPAVWHQDVSRDARKANALASVDYVRVRPRSLPPLPSEARVVLLPWNQPEDAPPAAWADVLLPLLSSRGLPNRALRPDEVAAAMSEAARSWQALTGALPTVSAATARPELVNQLVGNLTRPGVGLELLPPSAKDRCRWRCPDCCHEWEAVVGARCGSGRNRGRGSDCPACARTTTAARVRTRARPEAGRSLLDLHPAVADTFIDCLAHPDLGPADLCPSSNYRCHWKCPSCCEAYVASVAARVRGRACATCGRSRAAAARRRPRAGQSLAEQHPNLVREFQGSEQRPGVGPGELAAKANVSARWRCARCAHEWLASVASRAAGSGCPVCGRQRTTAARMAPTAGASLQQQRPDLAAEWVINETHPGRGPADLRPGSHDRCRWRCTTCDHTWSAVIKNRTRGGTGCPGCASRKSGGRRPVSGSPV